MNAMQRPQILSTTAELAYRWKFIVLFSDDKEKDAKHPEKSPRNVVDG